MRKADAVGAADSTDFCRGVLRNEARLKARIKELEEGVSRLQSVLGDPGMVVVRLRENLHHAGDWSIVRRSLQPNARRLRGKVRTLVLLDQAPESPAAEQKQKQGVDARAATKRQCVQQRCV
ncbi:hypothetical protein PR002_g11248 [Phytophthora rubi]|uniref:Uncharacterized protein n=1 Tax=Phytophthora rubi TaxID=129364 RepID=A0A6A3M9U6_9STRA|nr:hypothetical protein PR002_g11248 [Phytophthora rubi]